MIVIFAWWICLDGISERRKIGIIQILSLLDDQYHIALKFLFQFQFSLPYLTLLDEMVLEAMDDTDSSDSSISSSSSMAAAASRSKQNQNSLVKVN